MNQVVYIYILSYRSLSHLGMTFNPEYLCEVDENNKLISIAQKPSAVKGLYGERISSLTAIVGNNGAGKTTALRFLLNAVIDGSGHYDIHGLVITSNDEGLCVYSSAEFNDYSLEDNGLSVQMMSGWPDISTFIYDGYFRPLLSEDDIMTQGWAGSFNESDGYLLTHDLQEYGNELTDSGIFSFRDYAMAYSTQNNYRICLFLSQYAGDFRESLNLPKYIILKPNQSWKWAIANRNAIKKDGISIPPYEIPKEWTIKDQRLADIIFNSLCNLLVDNLDSKEYWLGCIGRWAHDSVRGFSNNIVETFHNYYLKEIRELEQDGEVEFNHLRSLYLVVSRISENCRIDDSALFPQFYYDVDEDQEEIGGFIRYVLLKDDYLTGRFFDLQYAHELGMGSSTLSSGEQLMLNLYSRIYDSVVVKWERLNYTPVLFVLDEAEIGFHPEWQRCFVSRLTSFLSDLAYLTNQTFQIILTSHSPIILSDIPAECAIVLKRGDDGETRNISGIGKQTFGTNIFDLYRESFFLENGLVGEFASEYMERLDKDIDVFNKTKKKDQSEERELLSARIKLIGDERIRKYFFYRLDENDRNRLIAYHQRKLRELRDE